MIQFRARTYHLASGAVSERLLEGESAESVRQRLEGEGLTVLSLAAQNARSRSSRPLAFNIVLFCDELRTLLSSGMSLVEAIDTLCTRDSQGDKHAVLNELRQRLLEGKPLSAALAINNYPFPPLLVASIRASERTSRLEHALEEYVSYEKIGQELSKKIVSAAIYPSLVVVFGFAVSLFMMSYVVPRFAKVYDDFAKSISLSTVVLMRIGQFFGDYLPYILVGIAGLFAMAVVGYRNGTLKRLSLRVLGRFKLVKYYLRLYQLSRIYQTLSMLLKGGYALTDAIPLAQNLAFEMRLHQQIAHARDAVVEGKRLSEAFARHGLTDSVTERLLLVGERSGNLAHIMEIIASTYRQEFMLFIERATRVAEPILLMAVGLMIGAIIILMYMPIFDLAGGI